MPIIYITGPAGAGKSTLIEEMKSRNIEAYDADVKLCGWYNRATGKKVSYPKLEKDRPGDWAATHSFRFSEELTGEFYEETSNRTVYLGGNAMGNDLEMANKYFEKVICLTLPEEVMIERVTTRSNNQYGNAPDELAILRKDFRETIERYESRGAVYIDSNRSLDEIISEILNV